MVRSTWGMSRPRAARSVVSRMAGVGEETKEVKLRVRWVGSCLPWRGIRV